MQQAAFDACGIATRYVLWETQPEALSARIASLRAPEMLGANVTLPYKNDALKLVDDIEPLAARVGAINTIVNRAGRLIGYNTDVQGFLNALAGGFNLPFDGRDKSAIILGTGGAARAAAVALIESRVEELVLLGRTEAHLHTLCQHLESITRISGKATSVHALQLESTRAAQALEHADILINATPVGLEGKEQRALIDIKAVSTRALVMDMIFNPPETPLLRAARARGCQTLNGLTMLLYQGALAFEHWTGQSAPIEAMRQALGC